METEDTSLTSVKVVVVAHWADNRIEIEVSGIHTAAIMLRDLFIPVIEDRRNQATKLLPVEPPLFAEILQTTVERMAYASPIVGSDNEPPAAA